MPTWPNACRCPSSTPALSTVTNKLALAAIALKLTHSRKAFPQPLVPKTDMIDAMFVAAQQQQQGR